MEFDRIRVVLSLNSSARAERSFAIRYLNIVIKPLCSNLDICLTTRLTPTFGHGILLVCFRSQIATSKCLFGSRFSVALLCNLADFATEIHFDREKPEQANAPNDKSVKRVVGAIVYRIDVSNTWSQYEKALNPGSHNDQYQGFADIGLYYI